MGQTLCLELPWVVSLNPFTAVEAHPGRNFVSFSWQYPKCLEQCVAQRKNSVTVDCMRTAVKIDCVITLALWKRTLLLGDTRAQGIVAQAMGKARKILAIGRVCLLPGVIARWQSQAMLGMNISGRQPGSSGAQKSQDIQSSGKQAKSKCCDGAH